MEFSIGHGGWVRFVLDEPQGLLVYTRFRLNGRGRYVLRELYLDGSDLDADFSVTGPDVEALPVDQFEMLVNLGESRRILEDREGEYADGVPLDVLASYFGHTFTMDGEVGERNRARNWVAAAYGASLRPDDQGPTAINVVRKQRSPHRSSRTMRPEVTYRLKAGPGADGLTDDFLARVARAYASAVARGEQPNASIRDQVGVPLKTVQRWVYTARQRGIMPAGRKGAVG